MNGDADFDGSRALVTAASKGLGRETARELVERGARVAIVSRSRENLEVAREWIVAETGADEDCVLVATGDLTAPDEIREAVSGAIDDLGGLDVLVTNHGGPPVQSIEETTVDELDDAYAGVIRGTFVTLRTALPALADGGGAVVNVVSATAREPLPGDVFQSLLRPGLYALSKSLSREYGPEVRVNCVCPRGIVTERLEHKIELLAEREGITVDEARKRRADELAVDDLGTPEEFASAVAFLASPEASYVTGTTLPVDGGWSRGAF
ncbi:SDR family oxidoreductase [Natrononativus amylolyticus]|uniref:SDR family oxidoreductase n=1 Tax=Natrononativus amylolyticus TaxID=2963434 RepID=UPI0020CC4D5D|nr:SDR family oxidoreductase [Natrononativus amylolyticus]